MTYQQAVPYPLRYLIALMAWAALMACALVLRFFLIPCIAIVFVLSSFGANNTQQTAQLYADIADRFLYGWPKFPRLLIGRRRDRGAGYLVE